MRYFFLLVFLVGCAPKYSADQDIRNIQTWSQSCAHIGQAIRTAAFLGRNGSLTESEAKVIDKIDEIYRPTCTGDPGPIGNLVTDQAVLVAVRELCPELGMPERLENAVLTVTQAAACGARKALLMNLEAQ